MGTEDNLDKYIHLLKDKNPLVSSLIHQLLECRAVVADNEINNRLLQELIAKYAESEIRLKQLNRELTEKQDRVEKDLIAASEIQKSLLPTNVHCGDILDVAWRFQPCEQIGGDIFNIIRLDDDHWAFYIIDVAGHGVPAAMVAVTVYQYLQPQSGNLIKRINDSPDILEIMGPARVLEFLDREYPFDRFNNFFTMNYVVLNIKTGALISSSAGHPPPLILRPDGTLVLLKKGGRPIGTIDLRLATDKPIIYREEQEHLGVEDKLLFYTDGAYEYQDARGEFYGSQRFYKTLIALKDRPLPALIEASFEALMTFGGNTPPKDDISLLGIQLKNPGTGA